MGLGLGAPGLRLRWTRGGGFPEAWGAPFVPPDPAGIVMYAVGVGKAVEEELREIASEPAELHVSYSPDFSTMTHLLENLKGSICPGEHSCLGRDPSSLSRRTLQRPFLFDPASFVERQPGVGLLDRAQLPKGRSVDPRGSAVGLLVTR